MYLLNVEELMRLITIK